MARKQSRYVNPGSVAVAMTIAVALALLGGMVWFRVSMRPVSSDTSTKLVRVAPAGTKAIGQMLKREGLIRSVLAFKLLSKSSIALGKDVPKAGYYDVSPSMSAEEIWDRICAGEVAKRKVTFPEGFTVAQMAERAAEKLQLEAAGFRSAAVGMLITRSLPFKLPQGKLEGYLFPTTYSFPVGGEAEEIVGEMAATFSKVFFEPHREEIAKSPMSVHEIVTLASMVEREARVADERPVIAGVYVNRLARDMKLQCDATVQYALGEHRSRLLYRDLEVDSPYNTYLHKGLPPGAICNPGLDSLVAALRPARHDYLYYVARADGSHIFTSTYQEHQRAIGTVR